MMIAVAGSPPSSAVVASKIACAGDLPCSEEQEARQTAKKIAKRSLLFTNCMAYPNPISMRGTLINLFYQAWDDYHDAAL
jgi:hypothetical protein